MIYLRLAGGLGNQLFQVAAAANISLRSNMCVIALIGGLEKYFASNRVENTHL